jgi:hypothetical protein
MIISSFLLLIIANEDYPTQQSYIFSYNRFFFKRLLIVQAEINYAITIIYFAAYRKYGILITILHTYWEKKWIKITLSRLAYL